MIASAFLLVTSFGTANALTVGTAATRLNADDQKGMYQLSAVLQGTTTPLVVFVDKDGVLSIKPYTGYGSAAGEKTGNALWCISVKAEEEGANPRFDFVNRAVGGELAVNFSHFTDEGLIDIGQGENKGWKFSSTYAKSLQAERPLTTYYNADTVLVLTYDGSTNKVGVVKRAATADGNYAGADILLFTVMKPAAQNLTADEYNTRFQTEQNDSIKLVFNKDRNNTKILNPWTDFALKAENSTFNSGALNFKRADGLYLRVDTAWTNASGVKFLAFAWGDIDETDIEQPVGGHTSIRGQYDFFVQYNFTNDQLDIRVAEAYMKNPDAAESARWAASAYVRTDQDSLRVKLQDLSVADEVRIVTIGTAPVNTQILFKLGSCSASSPNFTSLGNDLYLISRKTDAGLQYLAVPIYTFYDNSDTVPQWISLQDNVDPKQIPAYQWVVEKTRTTNTTTAPVKITNREFPRVASIGSVQLYTDKNTSVNLSGCHPGGTGSISFPVLSVSLNAASFGTPLAKTIKENETLGYFYIDSLTAKTFTYEFNYLHKYKDDDYLSVKSDKDSSLVVSGNKSMFKLDLINTWGNINDAAAIDVEEYGYQTDAVKDLVQLKRVRYGIRIPSGSGLIGAATDNRYITVDKEDRYAVSSYMQRSFPTYGTWNVYGIFYLKTNNTKNNTDYYALLDLVNGRDLHVTTQFYTNFVKVGIDDNSLWAYKQSPDETRTSAFAVTKYSEPLYRRFDGAEYGKKPVVEPYGDDKNAPVWLKFTKYNNLGNEFLFENSPKGVGNDYPKTTENDYRQDIKDKSISFLGLYNINQFEERGDNFSYTFYVDTAYVRGETPMPQYMLAIHPEIVDGDTIFKIYRDSTWNSQGELIDANVSKIDTTYRPGFTRGFWVFNAQDSTGIYDPNPSYAPYAIHNADYQGKFVYGAEKTTRLAFVDGIHMGDTFYVIRGQVRTTDIDSTFFWNIPAVDKHYLGENTHYDPRWYQDSWNYDWSGAAPVWKANVPAANLNRNGKSMVFQFRLVDPANDRRFLIESQREASFNQNEDLTYADAEIAPVWGRWLKIQNGVPVLSNNINVVEAQQNGAEIFDVLLGKEDGAVGNEAAPVVSSVQVIGETGAVTILNAGGKKVAISNILGQTVAARIISSDNVTIALPKGIVVVAVDGEAAVKAIVK
ncbi:MAG: DUF6383 domain-containing protein [Tannerellaceae bacterium]|nr:DUF6383 domain-containing protein [Tannerellaceae bacterium]